jgi:lipopolysaccharide/colanic/teichoic acid biosynthesis glycosyltransferase
VERYRIQEVIFLPGAMPQEKLANFVSWSVRRVLDVTLLTGYTDLVIRKARVATLAGRPVITYSRDTSHLVKRASKRLVDLVATGVLGVVALPVGVVYWALRRVRGLPAYRRERRIGREGAELEVVFPYGSVPDWIALPTLGKILAGRMSLVGPYPLPVAWRDPLEKRSPEILEERPGLTGPWRQLKRSRIDLEELLAIEVNYLRNWSPWVDLQIFLTTFWKILRGEGRYLEIEGNGGHEPSRS